MMDIGANLLSGQFRGRYNGSAKHAPDLDAVLRRADAAALTEIIVTAGSLAESRRALALARRVNASGAYRVRLHSTVGVHPTNTAQLEPCAAHAGGGGGGGAAACDCAAAAGSSDGDGSGGDGGEARPPGRRLDKAAYVAALERVLVDGLSDGTVVAVGECGLDYDRLHFAPRDTQLANFEFHFDLAARHGLPLFLHDRNTGGDFAAVARRHLHRVPGGVVHSFTGTPHELDEYLALGLDIGLNGCSLKSESNCAVAAAVPLGRLHLETDAPWCEIRRTHASFRHVRTHWPPAVEPKKHAPDRLVKGRSEPAQLLQVAEAVAGVRGAELSEVLAAAYANSRRLFLRR